MSENEEMRALCKAAGIPPSDIYEDPVHGICVRPSALPKLYALAPDQSKVPAVMDEVARAVRSTFKVVK